jgi:hypothetical protein
MVPVAVLVVLVRLLVVPVHLLLVPVRLLVCGFSGEFSEIVALRKDR